MNVKYNLIVMFGRIKPIEFRKWSIKIINMTASVLKHCMTIKVIIVNAIVPKYCSIV